MNGVAVGLLGLIYFLAPAGAAVYFGWLGLRFVRAKERAAELRGDRSDLLRLEEQMRELRTEIETLRDRQDFTDRLLQRPAGSPE